MRAFRLKLSLRLLVLPILIAGVSLAIAACGGSSNSSDTSSHHKTSHTGSSAAQTTSTAAKTTTTAKTTATSTTPKKTSTTATSTGTSTASNTGGAGLGGGSGLSECGVTDLSAKQLSSQGAAGTMIATYALTNSGSSSCWTYGYPGIGFVVSSGQELGTYPKRVTRDLAGNVGAPKKITLGSGQEASFRITVSQVSEGGGGDCENADSILITPPNSRKSLKLALHPAVAVCGSATVTPMLTGTSASPR